MNYRQLGRAGVKVSPIALGTANFAWLTDEADSFAMLDHAIEHGINLVDTSDNYNAGQTEALLGRYFARAPHMREKLVLATKCGTPPTEWASSDPVRRTGSWVGPNQRGLSAKHIREACDASLRRLGTDCIDLYQMHHVDRSVPMDEIWQALELLVQQGKILYVGSSNFAGWHIARANETAKARQFNGLVSEQSVYNLTKRVLELEVLPACVGYGMAFLPYSPLGGGLLGGKSTGDGRGRRGMTQRSYQQPTQLEQFQALCEQIGGVASQVALAWVLANPAVTSAITGPRTLAQLNDSLAALDVQLSAETLSQLDVMFPGPGGVAPEAYAW